MSQSLKVLLALLLGAVIGLVLARVDPVAAETTAGVLQPVGLLLAVDMVPDIFATVGNVTADMAATSVLAKDRVDASPADAAAMAAEPG